MWRSEILSLNIPFADLMARLSEIESLKCISAQSIHVSLLLFGGHVGKKNSKEVLI